MRLMNARDVTSNRDHDGLGANPRDRILRKKERNLAKLGGKNRGLIRLKGAQISSIVLRAIVTFAATNFLGAIMRIGAHEEPGRWNILNRGARAIRID
jgi:hypothetical protein